MKTEEAFLQFSVSMFLIFVLFWVTTQLNFGINLLPLLIFGIVVIAVIWLLKELKFL